MSRRRATSGICRLVLAWMLAGGLMLAQAVPAAAQESALPPVGAEAPHGTARSATDPLIMDPATDTEPGSGMPHDLSPWGMFLQADWVVKAVMIGLVIASVVTWTVWLVTSFELRAARREVWRVRADLSGAATLAEAVDIAQGRAGRLSEGAVRDLVAAAAHEIALSPGLPAEGIKERIASRLERIESAAQRHLTRGTGVLATIGSTAPFVGLFGTVWGIMNSFIGISEAQTTNLAVVAPGIAEALLATALGLVAAIPAVVIYNRFSRAISGYRALLGDISAELLRMVSRDLDQRHTPLREAAE